MPPGGTTATGVGRWNGSTWSSLGTGGAIGPATCQFPVTVALKAQRR